MNQKIIIKGKTAFYLFMLVCTIVTVTVWISGLDIHRTILNNAIYSLSIITIIFFAFVTYGLYMGVGFKDDFGDIKSKLGFVEPSGVAPDLSIGEFASEGIEGIVLGILIWIGMMILSVVLIFLFETIVFAGLIIFTGILYWIFFRATRMIFRYSKFTKSNLSKSVWIGFRYSLMYSSWIYGILWMIEIVKDRN